MNLTETCDTHPDTALVRFCPRCRASQGGKKSSAAKTEANRRNARTRWDQRQQARRGPNKKKSTGKASRRRRSVASR